MRATADRPSALELDQLADLLAANPLDREHLDATLGSIEQGLQVHAAELDRSGGLLDESDHAARPSLAREDERLREENATLVHDIQLCRESVLSTAAGEEVRRCASAILAALRGHRDAEASLVLESVDTEVGAGD